MIGIAIDEKINKISISAFNLFTFPSHSVSLPGFIETIKLWADAGCLDNDDGHKKDGRLNDLILPSKKMGRPFEGSDYME